MEGPVHNGSANGRVMICRCGSYRLLTPPAAYATGC